MTTDGSPATEYATLSPGGRYTQRNLSEYGSLAPFLDRRAPGESLRSWVARAVRGYTAAKAGYPAGERAVETTLPDFTLPDFIRYPDPVQRQRARQAAIRAALSRNEARRARLEAQARA